MLISQQQKYTKKGEIEFDLEMPAAREASDVQNGVAYAMHKYGHLRNEFNF